jgi:hypothetical protein
VFDMPDPASGKFHPRSGERGYDAVASPTAPTLPMAPSKTKPPGRDELARAVIDRQTQQPPVPQSRNTPWHWVQF